jgi:hypothetical protein
MSIQEYNETFAERFNWLAAKALQEMGAMCTPNNICACGTSDGVCGAHSYAYNEMIEAETHLRRAAAYMLKASRG